ncbi:MAG: DUF192 domain-containing protein [Candidatus Omnitrophota bacterium]
MKKNKFFRATLILTLLILAAGTIFWFTAIFRLSLPKKKIVINGKEISVWIAQTETAREGGLQNIIWLPKNSGMLFVFARPGQYCFWNKNTLRSLKLIFMRDGKVTEEVFLRPIWKGKQTICPVYDADSVLEVIE